MRIAILVPEPDYPEPWDWTYDAEAAALARHGVTVEPQPWTDPGDLSGYDLVLPLVAWGYHHHYGPWLRLLNRFDAERLPVANPPSPTALTVEITAHRWWWEIRYRGDRPADVIVTANHLVLPVGIPVRLVLTSDDVIHDFWVPKLGPKMDMIPGKTNTTWLEADRPGLYRGQCAEYCGLEHARMAFTAAAVPVNDFRRWRREQLQSQLPGVGRGAEVFTSACSACHTVRGTGAAGILGPDLTHFASRPTIAAGILPNTVAARLEWLGDTQGVKPGAAMPQVPLDDADRAAVAQYIGSLR